MLAEGAGMFGGLSEPLTTALLIVAVTALVVLPVVHAWNRRKMLWIVLMLIAFPVGGAFYWYFHLTRRPPARR